MLKQQYANQHIQLSHYYCRCQKFYLHSIGMNWLESLGLTSIPPKHQVSPFPHLQSGLDLRRRELLLHPSSSGIRRLVPSPPRSKTNELNWMVQLPKIFKFGNCSIQVHYKWPLLMHFRMHSLVQKMTVAVILRLVNLFWVYLNR